MKPVELIFQTFENQNPDPKGELFFVNNFTLLVAIVMSAQMTDVGVNKITRNLFLEYAKPIDFIQLGVDGIAEKIKSINYYKTKAKNIYNLSIILSQKEIPDSFEELIKLPGVGRKTANVFLNAAFKKNTIGVDTHVMRVSKRIGITNKETPEEVEKDLLKKIPEKYLLRAHHWLVLHGRYVCKAKGPMCNKCILKNQCRYGKKES